MIKKILLIAASVFLLFQSWKLMGMLDEFHDVSWITVIVLAWLLNLFVTGIFAFLGFALPTQKLLPSAYYQIRNPKRLQRVYDVAGVDYFKQFLLATFWRNRKQQKRYFNGRAGGLPNFITQTKKSEFGHLIPFVLILVLCVFLLTKNLVKLALVTWIINWIGNWYPIILQRHHRMRIVKFQEKLKNRRQRRKKVS